MKHLFSSCLFFLSLIYSYAQSNDCSTKNYFINIDSLKNVSYNNNLSDSLFVNSSIVLLGEETHGDGTAFLLKKELAEYLIKNYNYEVILFENGFYDLSRINDLGLVGSDFMKNIYKVWSNSVEFSGMYDLIKSKKIIIGGFDTRNKGVFSNKNLVSEIDSVTASNNLYNLNNPEYLAFKSTLNSLLKTEFKDTSSAKMRMNFYRVIDTITEKRLSKGNDWWVQEFKNLRHFGEQTWAQQTNENEYFRLRDKYMAENISWLKDNVYKNKKIIVWTANDHAAYLSVPYVRMGNFLRKNYGTKLACILSSSYKGEYREGKDIITIKKQSKNTIEYYLHSLGINEGIVVCKNLCPELSGKKVMDMDKNKSALELMDAILFIDTMRPSTLIQGRKE